MSLKGGEVFLNFLVWTAAVLYSLYCFQQSSFKDFDDNYQDDYNDFKEGWSAVGRKQDNADHEWQLLVFVIKRLLPWLLVHIVASDLIRTFAISHEIIQVWYVVWSLLFVAIEFNLKSVAFLSGQPLLFHFLATRSSLRNKEVAVWVLNLLLILGMNVLKTSANTLEHSAILSAAYWISLRCLYYHVRKIRSSKRSEDAQLVGSHFLDCFSYCLYLPALFLGPFMVYEDFQVALTSSRLGIASRLAELVAKLTRVALWFAFAGYALHYFYVNNYMYQPQKVFLMDSWSLYGYGYCMGQFFHIKYVIMYGLSTSLAAYEGMKVPALPKCIGRIHLYSDMWKFFDCGLYKFLLECIYVPTLKNRTSTANKSFSCFLCFFYVYLWHGLQSYILVWSLLNFIGVITETVCHKFYEARMKVYIKNVGSAWERRFISYCSGHLLAVSAISNFYFFAGIEIGNIFFYRLFTGGVCVNLVLIVVLYNCCQVSHRLKTWESAKKVQ